MKRVAFCIVGLLPFSGGRAVGRFPKAEVLIFQSSSLDFPWLEFFSNSLSLAFSTAEVFLQNSLSLVFVYTPFLVRKRYVCDWQEVCSCGII